MDDSMEYVKVDASVIGLAKPVKVAESLRNQRAAMVILKVMAQAEADSKTDEARADDDDAFSMAMLKGIDAQLGMIDELTKYVINTLSLTKKQAEKIEDISLGALSILTGSIAAAILGMTDKEPTEDDQKSDNL